MGSAISGALSSWCPCLKGSPYAELQNQLGLGRQSPNVNVANTAKSGDADTSFLGANDEVFELDDDEEEQHPARPGDDKNPLIKQQPRGAVEREEGEKGEGEGEEASPTKSDIFMNDSDAQPFEEAHDDQMFYLEGDSQVESPEKRDLTALPLTPGKPIFEPLAAAAASAAAAAGAAAAAVGEAGEAGSDTGSVQIKSDGDDDVDDTINKNRNPSVLPAEDDDNDVALEEGTAEEEAVSGSDPEPQEGDDIVGHAVRDAADTEH